MNDIAQAAGPARARQAAGPARARQAASRAGGTGASAAAGGPATAPPAAGRAEVRGGRDTRARIQQVAVELFTEHGYEGTSLREIAERLDVTKAALYYHFKSKEDIVSSLVEDYYGQIDALIAWGREQPRTAKVRTEIISRYVNIVAEGDQVFRMLHQNQAAVSSLASAKSRGELFKERIHSLIDLLTEPGAGLPERIRAAMALGGISVGWMFFADQVRDRHELSDIVRGVAGTIVQAPHRS
jgi:AcrR family transcriptional regulator